MNNLELATMIEQVATNPMAIQQLVLNTLENTSNQQVRIVDPSNPFVFLLEAASIAASVGINQAETLTRKQYPSTALEYDDLYRHMTDTDYIGRFATPAQTTMILMLSLTEFKSKAVDVINEPGVKKITIPKHTVFTVADCEFTIQYPIDIKLMSHGGISVLYDTSLESPIWRLTSDRVKWTIRSIDTHDYLIIEIPVYQMSITKQVISINNLSEFKKTFTYTDNYYYARAYNLVNGTWIEMRSTHNPTIYDPEEPTVLLRVMDGTISVEIPQIYFTNGSVKDTVRVDIYTTKGTLDLRLSNYDNTAFSAKWNDFDNNDNNRYSSPLTTFGNYAIVSDAMVTGGTFGKSFAYLRNQVISRSLVHQDFPITNKQVASELDRYGYRLVVDVDDITNRQFLATRDLPSPSDFTTVSGAGCSIHRYLFNIKSIEGHQSVRNHGDRLTLLPNAVYQNQNGVIKLIDSEIIEVMRNQNLTTTDSLVNLVNSGDYLFTPYHYVFDVLQDTFNARAYDLRNPRVTELFKIDHNPSLGIDAGILNYAITLLPDQSGYTVTLQMNPTDSFVTLIKQIKCQISYQVTENYRVYFNGVLVSPLNPVDGKSFDGEYYYQFEIKTKWDITPDHQLVLEPSRTAINLLSHFDIVFIAQDWLPEGSLTTAIDSIVNKAELIDYKYRSHYQGFLHERIAIDFGEPLNYLWQRVRTLPEQSQFLRYTADIPAVYSQTVYARDANGQIKLTYNAKTGKIDDLTVLHYAGDPILTADNEPVYQHRKNEVVLDSKGNPVILDGQRGLMREAEILFIDGKYYFATNQISQAYIKNAVTQLTHWMKTDIAMFASKLFERTEIRFYPKSTVGKIEVLVNDGTRAFIDADQSFHVKYYLTADRYKNLQLRESIKKTTGNVLLRALQYNTISVSGIISMLRDELGEDILSVEVDGFANGAYTTLTLANFSMRPSIGKRLVSLSNLTSIVQDAITVEFIQHLP